MRCIEKLYFTQGEIHGKGGLGLSATDGKFLYRDELDGLRALAVIAVIINHISPILLPNGYLGVDIFFVLSGFVITGSMANRPSLTLRDFLVGFYARRVRRLVPALVVFVLIMSLLIGFFNPDPSILLKTGITALFGLSNLYLLKQSTDYFAPTTELNIFAHTWSLGVEEQFYVLFPFLVWWTGFGRGLAQGSRNLFALVSVLSGASLVAFIFLYPSYQALAYFSMPTRFWELGAGCLLYLHSHRLRVERSNPLLVTAGIVVILFAPLKLALLTTPLMIVLTLLLIRSLRSDTVFFSHPFVVYVGRISYGLYLWHWGVLALSRWTIGLHGWSLPFQVALMLLLAMISYHYLERPLRRLEGGWIRWGYGSLLSTAALLWCMITTGVTQTLYGLANPGAAQYDRIPWKGDLEPPVRQLVACHKDLGLSPEDLDVCLPVEPRPSLYVIGDSHAVNYAFGVQAAFPERAVHLFSVGWGCGYIPDREAQKVTVFNCTRYRQMIDQFVGARLGRGDVVLLGMDWRRGSLKRRSPDLEKTVQDLARRVTAQGAYFVLFDDVPEVGAPSLCAKRWYKPFPPRSCVKTTSTIARDQAGLDRIGQRLEAGLTRSLYLSLRDTFCEPSQQCSVNLGDELIYLDEGHLTVKAAQRTQKHIRKSILALLR